MKSAEGFEPLQELATLLGEQSVHPVEHVMRITVTILYKSDKQVKSLHRILYIAAGISGCYPAYGRNVQLENHCSNQ